MDLSSAPKNQTPISVLTDCRTVIEKKDYVSTGILSFIEGDLIELEIGDYKAFFLGDSLKVTIYSPAGIHSFLSSIIAIDEGAVLIVNPPEIQKKFVDRREYTRVEVDGKGEILALHSSLNGGPVLFPEPLGIHVRNISLGGIGFYLDDEKQDVKANAVVRMEVDINGILPCVGQVVRKDRVEDGFLFGVRYTEVDPRRVNFLRAYILRAQVETRMETRNKLSGAAPVRRFK